MRIVQEILLPSVCGVNSSNLCKEISQLKISIQGLMTGLLTGSFDQSSMGVEVLCTTLDGLEISFGRST
jgi:hypothetical protein